MKIITGSFSRWILEGRRWRILRGRDRILATTTTTIVIVAANVSETKSKILCKLLLLANQSRSGTVPRRTNEIYVIYKTYYVLGRGGENESRPTKSKF